MKHYLHPVDEVFTHVASSENGLTEAEAQARLEKNGKNKLDEGKKKTSSKTYAQVIFDAGVKYKVNR